MASSSRHPQTSSSQAANDDGDPMASSSNSGGGSGVDPDELLEAPRPRLSAKLLGGLFRSWRSLLSKPLSAAGTAADGARRRERLIVASRRSLFEEEADVELLDASSGGRVVRRVPRCAGISYPRNPPMRAHHGLVLLAGGNQVQRHRVVDPATGAVAVLPDHGESLVNFPVLGRALSISTGGEEEEGEYKVFTVTVDDDLVQSCKVLTLSGGVGVTGNGGGGGGVWREAPKPPARVRCDKPWVAAAVAGGVVYILAFHRRDKADWIAAFDLGTEQWRPGLLQGPPAAGPVSGLTETDDGRLVAVSGAFAGDDTSSTVVELWVLVGCNADKQALWQLVCTVPPMARVIGHEKAEEPVWVLDSGRVAAVVWSPAAAAAVEGEVGGGGERGCQNWVLRVYDTTTEAFEDVARLSNSSDVAIGVYTGSSDTLI